LVGRDPRECADHLDPRGNPIVSNAVTTATVSVGLSGGSATYFSTAQDVKSAAIGNFSQAATANWVPVCFTSQNVTCTYTETGGASSAGNRLRGSLTYCVL
jgi:hypothetical protein